MPNEIPYPMQKMQQWTFHTRKTVSVERIGRGLKLGMERQRFPILDQTFCLSPTYFTGLLLWGGGGGSAMYAL